MQAPTDTVDPTSTLPLGSGMRDLYGAFQSCLAPGGERVARLATADTSVAFTDAEGAGFTLLVDRARPILTAIAEPAEITFTLSDAQAGALAGGLLPLAVAVPRGDVRVQGPARKFLEVDAVLQGLLQQHGVRGACAMPLGEVRPTHVRASYDPEYLAVQTTGLRKAFGPHTVLDGVDLQIPTGLISVIAGPSGTGKSVMIQHITGLLAPDEGEVVVRGRPLSGLRPAELLALRADVGVMFQDGALFSAMNVYDNVAFPLRQHTDLEDHEIREVVMEHLASVGLEASAKMMPGQLSGGMRKRAGLARALALDPHILIADEPDSGLDPVRTALLSDLLQENHAATGGTVIVVTHNVGLIRQVAQHISVLWNGAVVASGMAEDVLASDDAFVRQFLAGETTGPLGMDA